MTGFLLGTLTLIAFYALGQPGAPAAAESASNVFQRALRRALSPEVAGVPNRAAPPKTLAEPPKSPDLGGPGIKIPGI